MGITSSVMNTADVAPKTAQDVSAVSIRLVERLVAAAGRMQSAIALGSVCLSPWVPALVAGV